MTVPKIHGQLHVVNVLAKEYYDDCHIMGSINVPHDNLKSKAASWSHDDTYVVYCARYECPLSTNAAKALHAMGFKHVYAYEAGMAGWYQAKLPYQGLAQEEYLNGKNDEPDTYLEDRHPNSEQRHFGLLKVDTFELKSMLEEAGIIHKK